MENTKDKIFCYSGTGNSLAAAKQLAGKLDMQVVHLTDEITHSTVTGERCIIIFPTYAYCLPNTAKRFILNSSFNVKYFAVLTTVGSSAGGALAEAIRLLKKQNQSVHYTNSIKSVENYVHMFGFTKEDEVKKEAENQKNITEKIISDLKEQKQNKRILFRPISMFIAAMFRSAVSMFEKKYKFTDACTNCGICAKVCPARAIEISENSKPKLRKKQCDHCQACMQLCPNKAIKFGRVTPNGKRYCHPDIHISDMLKR